MMKMIIAIGMTALLCGCTVVSPPAVVMDQVTRTERGPWQFTPHSPDSIVPELTTLLHKENVWTNVASWPKDVAPQQFVFRNIKSEYLVMWYWKEPITGGVFHHLEFSSFCPVCGSVNIIGSGSESRTE